MDVDNGSAGEGGLPPVPGDGMSLAAVAATGAALVYQQELEKRETTSRDANSQVNTAQLHSNLISQCSTAKKLSRNMDVYSCTVAETGSNFSVANASIPRIGQMFREDVDYKTFHGARMFKGGIQCNEVISCTFDPTTLNCVTCSVTHPVLNKATPTAMCFTDQNFVSNLSNESGSGCVVVLRYEDATLADLSAIAIEILENHSVTPGTVLLFGSLSHLNKVGASCYAAGLDTIVNENRNPVQKRECLPSSPGNLQQCFRYCCPRSGDSYHVASQGIR
jgi:hypothetical protein